MISNLTRKLATAVTAAFCLVCSLSAANFYVAQTALGSGNGSTAANAASTTFFNNYGNWSSTVGAAGVISPGSTVNLVGTITSQLVVQGSGVSGNPITILFQPNAVMTSPAWPNSGAINVGGNGYIVVDGGSNGLIEDTANGDALANQVDSTGVCGTPAPYLVVQNLTVANMYVRVANSSMANGYGSSISNTNSNSSGLTGFTVTNCILHDAYIGIASDYGAGCSNYTFSFNTIYNCNWGGYCADRDAQATMTGLVIHDNHIYNFSNWDQPNDNFHHNGFYAWAESGGTLGSVAFYNNTIGPNFGANATSGLFSSGQTAVGPYLIYNNVFVENAGDAPDNGLITIGPGPGAVTRIYNNTFIGGGVGNAIQLGSDHGGTQTYDVRNNLDNGTATFIYVGYSGSCAVTSDYNDGYNLGAGEQFCYDSSNSGSFFTFAQWQAMGFDAHSTSGNPNLNNLFVPQPVSAAIGSGTTVESNGTTLLSSIFTTDMLGVSRTQGADIGAFEYASGGPVFTTQPSSQTVAAGVTVTFTAAATGTPNPTFEWMKGSATLSNGGNISGSTTGVLTVSSVSASDVATYSAVATNSSGVAASNGAVLTLAAGSPPAITSLLSLSATVQSSFAYTITASNSPTSFKASGLPAGLSVNTATGSITGTPTATGTSAVALSATNAAGTGSASLALTITSAAPVVTSATSASATVGSAFSYTIAASNSPTSFNATGLPAGLSVNTASGSISGTPTSAGTSPIAISAKNAGGTGSASLTLTIASSPPLTPVVTSASSAGATVGSAFSYTIAATNSPTSYNATGLPSSLSVNTTTGVISGTPTSAGSSAITIHATNAAGTASATLTLTVAPIIGTPSSIAVKNAWLGLSAGGTSATATVAPSAGNLVVVAVSGFHGSYANHAVTDNKGSVYTRVVGANVSATGLTGSLWYLANAPAGVTSILGSSGATSEATTVIVHEVAGASAFTSGESAATTMSATTNPRTASVSNGTANSIFFALCVNSSGSNPATLSTNASGTTGTWNLFSATTSQEKNGATYIAASMPNLIVASSQAEVQGWTTGKDSYGEANVLLIAAFHSNETQTQTIPVISSAPTATANVGSAFSYSITASNTPTSYGAIGLPTGLSVNAATGTVSGTPTAAGTSTVTISATNATGTGTTTLSLTVNPAAPVITSTTSAAGTVGSAFSYSITASNSPASFSAAGLPAGLTVNTATGGISGTPTAAGSSTVTISAVNAGGTGSASVALTVNSAAPPVPLVTSATSAGATVGSAFSYTIAATNSPTSYNATGLPAGLSVNTTTGVISGTPTAAGASIVSLSASNAGGTASATLTLTVTTPSSAPISVKNAWLGVSGGTSSATVAVSPTAGNLVVVAVSGYWGTYADHTVTDNKGSVYTRVAGADVSATDLTGSLWYLANAPTGITSIIGSTGTTSQATTVIVHEVVGATAFTSGEASATTASGTTNPQTASIVNGTPNSILFALCVNSSGSNPATISPNGSGSIGTWNLFSATASQETNGSSYIAASMPNLTVASSQTEQQGWTTAADPYGETNVLIVAAFH